MQTMQITSSQALTSRTFPEVIPPPRTVGEEPISHAGVARSLRYIQQNYQRPIRVADLVKLSGLSPRGYMKAFQRHTGLPPGKLLRRLRIEWAKGLLLERKHTLAELTEACGFKRLNSFAVTFRREVGMSPMQYRLRRNEFAVSQTF